MISKDIFQHFHSDEHDFIERMTDMVLKVEDTYHIQVTDFLNPREIDILKVIAQTAGLVAYSSCDYYETEYGKVIIAPEYYEFNQDDFDIALVELRYNAKFNQITHSQILGTLINELGIKRSLLGDIFVQPGYAQIMINQSLLSYFINTINRIGRASVSLKEINLSELIKSSNNEQEFDIMVSSLRLDRLIASAHKLSRVQAIKLIESDKVKINYRAVNRSSEEVSLGDLVSVRGFGRFKVISDNGYTKNGKYKLTLSKTMRK